MTTHALLIVASIRGYVPRSVLSMIGVAIATVLGPGLGAAISPMAIVAVLILLTSTNGPSRARFFSLGVFSTTALIAVLVLAVSLAFGLHESGHRALWASLVSLCLGVLLLVFGYRQWRSRPRRDTTSVAPRWMASLENTTQTKAFILGCMLSLANAKNIPLTISTFTAVVQHGATVSAGIVAVAVFAVLGSAGVILPLLAARFGGATMTGTLREAKGYLVEHNALILAIVFALLGAETIGKALGHIFG
ncbi:hypothetical protein GCM10022381_03060 [Leifsonia kafniensis]|uniref:GAP family protein n=1 Tax=Leifsonia kafniensis TaxID=475957 RepID=A0ABP7K1E7_9MICO